MWLISDEGIELTSKELDFFGTAFYEVSTREH